MSRSAMLLFAFLVPSAFADDSVDRMKVGRQPDGRIVVPTNQILQPAGLQVAFPGRPVDLVLIDDGRTLVVKDMHDLVFIDVGTGKVVQRLAIPKKGKEKVGFSVVGLLADGSRLFATDFEQSVRVASRHVDGKFEWNNSLTLRKPVKGGADVAGIARLDSERLLVATTRTNSVQLLNQVSGMIEQDIPVGVAPYGVLPIGNDRAYVSNWGGDRPGPGDVTADSSGTSVKVNPRTRVVDHGSVSVLTKTPDGWKATKSISVGVHPSGMTANTAGRFVYVANAASDTVSVIDTTTDFVIETISCRPTARLPFGSGSNALAISPSGETLYVANGTNNCIAVVRLGKNSGGAADSGASSTVQGLIPTGWYPAAVRISADGKRLFVANVKGHGALSQPRDLEKGGTSHDYLGTVSLIDVPTPAELAAMTNRVNASNRLAYSLAGLEKPRSGVGPVPVPERHGEPSVFEHVLYIIKENRTYDQVFGDVKQGNGDPRLCIFGEETTPNHHKLAGEFVLLDNFYCSGVVSADGHSWADSAYVTDYLEKAFGAFPRSYPDDGRDALAFAPTGFLWDNALLHGRTLRNYGEFVAEEEYTPKGTTWTDMYQEHVTGIRKIPITTKVRMKSLEPHTHPTYPYFPLTMPDASRADLFIQDLRAFEESGKMPNLLYMSLPCDHTDGTKPNWPTPRAMVADNDLALGRIVEAISKSRFWPKTCILVVEDDPQAGFDHVDGHRTVALCISPYTRRRVVDSTQYNQTGMVKTIEMILGLPPMNQLDLAATPMRNCFQETADLTPYQHAKNRIALDEMNKPVASLRGRALFWAKKSMEMNFDEGDAADENTLNRILWFSVRGDEPYPGDKK
jgi:YVTN family beta-propeller protein